MIELRGEIRGVLEEIQPATVRQAFYQLVSRGIIDKTELAYKSLVRMLTVMRREHEIPFAWLADNTRWMRKPTTYSSLTDMLEQSQQFYRRALWDDQDAYVEIWLEKDALSGVLYPITENYDVPLMVTRGYASVSYLHNAAMAIEEKGKPTFLYYFGDFDPSGVDITRAVDEGIREFAPHSEIEFRRVAVTNEQIQELNLPTRPTKATDSRKKNFKGESVEVDAIEPATLRAMVEACITRHIAPAEMQRLEIIEEQKKQTLRNIIGSLLPEPEKRSGSRLRVREVPTAEDRKQARKSDCSAQVFADLRVIERDAPDLMERDNLSVDEAIAILEERRYGRKKDGGV